MGAPGQPAQHIFGADDGQGEGFEGPVEGGDEDQRRRASAAARRSARKTAGSATCSITSMLRMTSKVSPAAASSSAVADAIVDCELPLGGMDAGGADILLGRVDRRRPRRRAVAMGSRQEPAAAADIEQASGPVKGRSASGSRPKRAVDLLRMIGKPDRIETVQDGEFARRDPTIRRRLPRISPLRRGRRLGGGSRHGLRPIRLLQ